MATNMTESNNTTDTSEIKHLFHISDMNFQIIFAICTMSFNTLAFLIFYFGNSKNNSIISKLTIFMFLSESISYYCNIIQLYDFARVVDILKIRTIFSIFTFTPTKGDDNYYHNYTKYNWTLIDQDGMDTFSPSIFTLFKINTSIFSASLTASIFLQMFISIELVNIFKNPISDFSKRIGVYFKSTIIFSIFSFLISFFHLIEKEFHSFFSSGYTETILVFYAAQKFNLVIIIVYMLTSLFSIYYMISIMTAKSSFRSKEKIIFCISHITYMIIYYGFLIYPLYCFFSNTIIKVPVRNIFTFLGCYFPFELEWTDFMLTQDFSFR